MSEPSTPEAETLVRVEGRAGRITLNRPKALNALSYAQVGELQRALDAWRNDDRVALVILDGAGERGLCAGGDVRALYHARESDPRLAARFWADEYRLNADIASYPKPFVAIMDGIVMGGGIGLSAHASHRIVTEASRLAMPETAIGLIPDVGGTWLLSRAPGRLGEYLGLLGTNMGAADGIYANFADAHVARQDVPQFVSALCNRDGHPVGVLVAEATSAPPPATIAGRMSVINRIFAEDTVSAIIAAATAESAPDWLREEARGFAHRSPLSMTLTLEAVRRARNVRSLREALVTEYRLTNRLFDRGEFLEGVRAQLIDKDRAPKWQHGSVAAIPADEIAGYFAPLEDPTELTF
ncbi:MAG: enoyl-CoA hydratase/isomerase family protein [Hyphomicrobiaceae bacterium]